jgi:NAD(P)H-dependent flavin oxidoreductase YrpB (nitropropane dioxygenase family)
VVEQLPIVAAPMAGGPSTPELAVAVAEAGGMPFLAGGYKTPDALASEIARVRVSGHRFGVNLFVPGDSRVEVTAFAAYADDLRGDAEVYGLSLDPVPVVDDDGWSSKLDLLLAEPVPVVSFTFGLPAASDIAALRRAGITVWSSVTTAAEAVLAERAGVDGLVVQGTDAGGHSATFDPTGPSRSTDTAALVRSIRTVSVLPLVAAGGVDGPVAVRRLLDAGAERVAVGTLLLRTDEAGTSAAHRAALADPAFTETAITRVFTGRPARALRNGFIDRHERHAIDAYPAVHHLTRGLRQAAAAAGDTDRLHLWAGTGWRRAPTGRAGDVISWLAGRGE